VSNKTRSSRENQRQTNREKMPNVAAMVDQMKAHVGDRIKVEWAYDESTGYEIGGPPDEKQSS